MKSLCVYCGSRFGNDPAFAETARELGAVCAQRGITLVYGGGKVGLMGMVADAALAAGGQVIGVIPEFMVVRELAHPGLTRLDVVATMHERKHRMSALADAFVALPGGIGTLEEIIEILSWRQLGLHEKPVGLLNTDGFYSPLLQLFHAMDTRDFFPESLGNMLQVADTPAALLKTLAQAAPVRDAADNLPPPLPD